jgi:hypothetical protein
MGAGSFLMNCVVDANTDDGILNGSTTSLIATAIIGCRVTNHTGLSAGTEYGLNCNGEPLVCGWSYFEDNEDNIYDETSALFQFVPEAAGTTTNVEDQADTNEGYTDKANHNFSTKYRSIYRMRHLISNDN